MWEIRGTGWTQRNGLEWVSGEGPLGQSRSSVQHGRQVCSGMCQEWLSVLLVTWGLSLLFKAGADHKLVSWEWGRQEGSWSFPEWMRGAERGHREAWIPTWDLWEVINLKWNKWCRYVFFQSSLFAGVLPAESNETAMGQQSWVCEAVFTVMDCDP